MKRIVLIFGMFLLSLVFAYSVCAADGTGGKAYNWSGFYIGAHGGLSWGNSGSNTKNTVTGESVGTGGSSVNNGFGGLHIGNDFMLTKNILFGLEFGGSYINASNDETTSNASGTSIHTTTGKTNWSESLTARVGYVHENWLFYGKGGVVFDQGDVTRTQKVGTTGLATAGTSENVSNNRTGWTIGGGIEYGFAPNWSAFVEYRYGASNYTITFPIAQRSSDVDAYSNTIIFGLNYKFNWGSTLY